MSRIRNMPPKEYSEFWDGPLFVLADTETPFTLDKFTPMLARKLGTQVMRLALADHADAVNAARTIGDLLRSSGLSFRDLADRVEGEGAVPRRVVH